MKQIESREEFAKAREFFALKSTQEAIRKIILMQSAAHDAKRLLGDLLLDIPVDARKNHCLAMKLEGGLFHYQLALKDFLWVVDKMKPTVINGAGHFIKPMPDFMAACRAEHVRPFFEGIPERSECEDEVLAITQKPFGDPHKP